MAGVAGGTKAGLAAIRALAPLTVTQVRPAVGKAARLAGAAGSCSKPQRRTGAAAGVLLTVTAGDHAQTGGVAIAA